MRIGPTAAIAATLIRVAPAVMAAPISGRTAALNAGDWRGAAELGASAADVVRALQAKGQFTDMVPSPSVVTIGPDNRLEIVALKPLPPLSNPAGGQVRTAALSGSGFAFAAKPGSIILYPAYARSFATNPPANRARP